MHQDVRALGESRDQAQADRLKPSVNTASVSCARPWDTNLSQDNRPISRLGWIEGSNLQIEAAVTEGLA